ncbi:hypothetical protein [Streptomyces sp. V1I6]|uniref:hypothetical protein n=1 Tax=Streptomyces sp. V1I6 TaxID=3042273 RepID=UPI003594286A
MSELPGVDQQMVLGHAEPHPVPDLGGIPLGHDAAPGRGPHGGLHQLGQVGGASQDSTVG